LNSFDKAQFIEIDADNHGQRIDNFLFTFLKGVPKSRVYRIIRKGEVRVNKGRIKAEYKLQSNDLVRIPPIRVTEKIQSNSFSNLEKIKHLENTIIVETNQYMVVNKPSGIAVHGGSGLSYGLIEALRALRPKEKFLELVHRLDRDTSGCILIAKRRSYLIHFQNQLRHRRMNKEYVAVVSGQWSQKHHKVKAALRKTERPSGEREVIVDSEGKPSETHFTLEQNLGNFSLVVAKPITGRTHQIRVHARHCFCPLLGDQKYSNLEHDKDILQQLKLKTFLLHARRLTFKLPEEEQTMTVEAPLPDRMSQVIEQLKAISN
jgi:23S rRNA pseudouridine955/2504/2580 synthase